MKKIYLLLVTLSFVTSAATAQDYFDNFPVNADPKTVAERLSKRFLESKHQLYFDKGIHYAEVCIGTGKKNSRQYYLDRPRIAGDFHGQAPILWCAYALLAK